MLRPKIGLLTLVIGLFITQPQSQLIACDNPAEHWKHAKEALQNGREDSAKNTQTNPSGKSSNLDDRVFESVGKNNTQEEPEPRRRR